MENLLFNAPFRFKPSINSDIAALINEIKTASFQDTKIENIPCIICLNYKYHLMNLLLSILS